MASSIAEGDVVVATWRKISEIDLTNLNRFLHSPATCSTHLPPMNHRNSTTWISYHCQNVMQIMIISDNESQRDNIITSLWKSCCSSPPPGTYHSIIIILNADCLLFRQSNTQIDNAQNKLLLQHRYVARASPNSRIRHFDSIR